MKDRENWKEEREEEEEEEENVKMKEVGGVRREEGGGADATPPRSESRSNKDTQTNPIRGNPKPPPLWTTEQLTTAEE